MKALGMIWWPRYCNCGLKQSLKTICPGFTSCLIWKMRLIQPSCQPAVQSTESRPADLPAAAIALPAPNRELMGKALAAAACRNALASQPASEQTIPRQRRGVCAARADPQHPTTPRHRSPVQPHVATAPRAARCAFLSA